MKENSYRHIYLYAKKHYKISNNWEDLRKIIGQRSGIGFEHITNEDVLRMLCEIAYKHINTSQQFLEFVSGILPTSIFYLSSKNEYNINDAILNKLLSIISLTKVTFIDGNLGKPDFDILPEG